MSSPIKVIVFDDGSLQSKILDAEKKKNKTSDDPRQVVKISVPNVNLEQAKEVNLMEDYIKKIDPNLLKEEDGGHVIVELHFTLEDFDKFNLDKQINAIRNQYRNISFIKSYAFMSRMKLERIGKNLGALKETQRDKDKTLGRINNAIATEIKGVDEKDIPKVTLNPGDKIEPEPLKKEKEKSQ